MHTAQLMPLPLTASCFSKIQMVLPFWHRLTRVVLDKGPLNGCVCKRSHETARHRVLEAVRRQPALGEVDEERPTELAHPAGVAGVVDEHDLGGAEQVPDPGGQVERRDARQGVVAGGRAALLAQSREQTMNCPADAQTAWMDNIENDRGRPGWTTSRTTEDRDRAVNRP